ncbi:response regulator transcription factor [Paenibacillus sp. 1P07SE]|uniref:response regulator transcription factor n=1 Tax=Paenibacillus sp. 1P07SE TaxID=3132209 RepID=UPI0039A68316
MYKIVIVDDEMIVRHAVKSMINWEAFEWAGSAAGGGAALELVRRTDADIVITDMKMPGMDGLALIKELKAADFEGEVIVLSNYNDFELVREALKCGAHDYVLKLTLKSEQFAETLREVADKLDERRAARPHKLYATGGAADARERMRAWLQAVDTEGPAAEADGLPVPDEFEALRSYAFLFYTQPAEEEQTQMPDFAEPLNKLADGVFPGHRGLFLLPGPDGRYLLIAACPADARPGEAEELARRIIKLAQMYYNTAIGAIYGEPVPSAPELAEQIRRCRLTEVLRFYTAFRDGCFPNSLTAVQAHEAFRQIEQGLRESLRTSGETSVELWMERAVQLVEKAAGIGMHPAVLKRAIAHTVWGMAGTAMVDTETSWNEKPWIDRMEQADTDTELLLLIREMTEEMVGVLETSTPDAPLREEIKRAAAYLEERYGERIAISDIAHHVGLSEPYLCQLFKAETGSSIITRLNEIRMAKAYEMLASGQYLIKQVAISVGIPDPFYFNRLFRKRFGMAPKLVKNKADKKMDDFQTEEKKL